MCIYKLESNLTRLCIPKWYMSLAEKQAFKWIRNELHDLKIKLLSHDKVIDIPCIIRDGFHYDSTSDCKPHPKKANESR